MIRFITLSLSLLIAFQLAADTLYENRVFDDKLRSVQLQIPGELGSRPFLRLGSGQLELVFDDLDADFKNYQYTFVHCNADWTPSDLIKSEYMEGYQQELIRDYRYSFNTFIPYTHYTLSFPNEYVRFTKSGNYILIVYLDDPKEPALQLRFVVWENLVSVSSQVDRANTAATMMEQQQVDFNIFHGDYPIPEPFRDLKVVIMQNRRWDNAITGLKPRFLSNGSLNYDYDLENNFPGGNEFREFETKDMRTLSMRVRKIEIDTSYIAYVMPEESRRFKQYATWEDINGAYLIRKQDGEDPHTEADYVLMDFLVYCPEELPGGLYLFGEVSLYQLNENWALQYDKTERAYRGRFYIKQGFYNYFYATETPEGKADIEVMEGNNWQTENEYTLLVYHREMGSRYDRVVGFGSANYFGD